MCMRIICWFYFSASLASSFAGQCFPHPVTKGNKDEVSVEQPSRLAQASTHEAFVLKSDQKGVALKFVVLAVDRPGSEDGVAVDPHAGVGNLKAGIFQDCSHSKSNELPHWQALDLCAKSFEQHSAYGCNWRLLRLLRRYHQISSRAF